MSGFVGSCPVVVDGPDSDRPVNTAGLPTETGVVDASALGFAELGKTITVSGSVIASGPTRTWSVRGTLVSVTHQNPILTMALSWPEHNLSSVVVSPSADVSIDDD
jgi:hypothetical protein